MPARAFSFAILAGIFFQALNATARHLTQELPPLEVSWGRWITGWLFVAPFLLRGGFASVRTAQMPRHAVVMFGSESGGLSDALLRRATEHVRIPGTGAVESLNVSVAAGICLFEARRQRRG